MNRARFVMSILVCIAAVSLVASPSHLPAANTKKAIVSYVDGAANVVRKNGADCTTFSSKAWQGGDYYIFVVGPDDKLLCHVNAAMVGKLQAEIVNGHGDKVGEKVDKAARRKNGGWVDYMWARPGTNDEAKKSTYARTVKGLDGKQYVVGAGGWNLK